MRWRIVLAGVLSVLLWSSVAAQTPTYSLTLTDGPVRIGTDPAQPDLADPAAPPTGTLTLRIGQTLFSDPGASWEITDANGLIITPLADAPATLTIVGEEGLPTVQAQGGILQHSGQVRYRIEEERFQPHITGTPYPAWMSLRAGTVTLGVDRPLPDATCPDDLPSLVDLTWDAATIGEVNLAEGAQLRLTEASIEAVESSVVMCRFSSSELQTTLLVAQSGAIELQVTDANTRYEVIAGGNSIRLDGAGCIRLELQADAVAVGLRCAPQNPVDVLNWATGETVTRLTEDIVPEDAFSTPNAAFVPNIRLDPTSGEPLIQPSALGGAQLP